MTHDINVNTYILWSVTWSKEAIPFIFIDRRAQNGLASSYKVQKVYVRRKESRTVHALTVDIQFPVENICTPTSKSYLMHSNCSLKSSCSSHSEYLMWSYAVVVLSLVGWKCSSPPAPVYIAGDCTYLAYNCKFDTFCMHAYSMALNSFDISYQRY